MDINAKLERDICQYCELNGLDFNNFCEELLKKAFWVEKYGDKPLHSSQEETKNKQEIEPVNKKNDIFDNIIPQDKEKEVKEIKKKTRTLN